MRNLIISAMLSLFLLFPMTINADMILNDTTTAADSTTDFTVSKNVTITYAITTSGGTNVGFTAVSNHLSGDALYGAGSDTTQLFRNTADKTKGTLYDTPPTASNSTAAFVTPANWTAM